MTDPSEPRDEQPAREKSETHSAENARGAEIILRTRGRRIVFFGGLVAFVILVLLLGILRAAAF